MGWKLLVVLLFFIGLSPSKLAWSLKGAQYDIYITVGKGTDGEGGPISKADVTLTSPDGSKKSGKSDDEGAVKFTVSATGRYMVNIKAKDFDDYEGRIIVDGKDPQVYHLAVLEEAKPTQDVVLIRVRVKDDETGLPIEGASIETTSKEALPFTDRMTSDQSGEAVVRVPIRQWKRNTDYVVTVRSDGYSQWIHILRADNRATQMYPVDAALIRDKDLVLVAMTVLEEGTRAPILGAKVTLDGGRERFYSGTTQPGGTLVMRVKRGAKYSVKVTSERYDELTDSLDLLGSNDPSVAPTFLLSVKQSAREIRRALLVTVKFKDKKGRITPGKDAVVEGPGLHGPVTDESGRMVFLHAVPPGEMIRVTASHLGHKTAGGEVLVKDKGVMVDLRQFSQDTRSMSDYEAVKKQGVTGSDSITITLEEEWLSLIKVLGKIVAPNESDPGESVSYSTELTLQEGQTEDLTIEETIQVFGPDGKLFTRAGSIRTLNEGELSTKDFAFTPTKSGTYRIKSSVSFEKQVLWTSESSVRITEDRTKITISGNVVPKKGIVKLDEPINVGVNVLFESGPEPDLRVSETVELFDPKGQVVQNNFSHRNLKRQAYSERNFNIVCQAPGTYTLKSTVKDEAGAVMWTGSGKFLVEKGKAVMSKPGSGYYRLKNKVMGGEPGGGEGPYGFVTASISESSFTYSYTPKPPWEAYADINITWSVPPTILKPNDSIQLTLSGKGSVRGKDSGAVGTGAGWGVKGNASIVEKQGVFVGRASDGKDYPSASGKYKISIGRGGEVTIFNYHGGAPGISGASGQPCTYHYEWVENAAPPTSSDSKKPTMNVGSETSKPYNPAAYRSSSVAFGTFGSFSLEVNVGKDFHGSGKSKDGRSIITVFGSVNAATGNLNGSGTLNRNGSKYTITFNAKKQGNDLVGQMVVKASKGNIVASFRLSKS